MINTCLNIRIQLQENYVNAKHLRRVSTIWKIDWNKRKMLHLTLKQRRLESHLNLLVRSVLKSWRLNKSLLLNLKRKKNCQDYDSIFKRSRKRICLHNKRIMVNKFWRIKRMKSLPNYLPSRKLWRNIMKSSNKKLQILKLLKIINQRK